MRTELFVKRISEDKLTSQTWWFWYSDGDHALYLDRYQRGSKESTRKHNYSLDSCYIRIFNRESDMSVEEVPLPQDVLDEAKKLFVDSLEIKIWNKK